MTSGFRTDLPGVITSFKGGQTPRKQAMPSDVNIIDDPATAEEWEEAVGKKGMKNTPAGAWDPRMFALIKKYIRLNLTHVNQYTGIPFGQDPSVAIYELTNEEWLFSRMSKGELFKLPAFFQKSFIKKWNDWLAKRYADEKSLRRAWNGSLMENESMADGSVLFIPPQGKLGDTQMKLLGVDIPDYQSGNLTPADLSKARNSDAIRFLLDTQIAYKTELYDFVRTLAPKGVGCNINPIILDTGFGHDMQSPYLHMHGDASAHDVYVSGFTDDKGHPRYPWFSGIEEPPRLYHDNPWLEQNHIRNKPFFVYEIGFFKPSKYFAEFPLRVAALGAIQDWDVVVWHYWGHPKNPDENNRYSFPLQYVTKSHYWQGVHFQSDEIQSSQMLVAGKMFINGDYASVEDPTVFVFGKDSVFDPQKITFGDIDRQLAPTTYRYGSRIDFDPNSDKDYVLGKSVKRGREALPPTVKPTNEITYAWHDSYMLLQSPKAIGLAGFLPKEFSFSGEVKLSDIKLNGEPEGLSSNDRYVCFAMASDSEKELKDADKIYVSLVSTASNTGFELSTDKLNQEFNPLHLAAVIKNYGSLPVVVERVGI